MKGIQSNSFLPIIAQAIAEMEEQYGEFSSIDDINLAELERLCGAKTLQKYGEMVQIRSPARNG